ncbi:hypothetical protein ACLOJK_034507 [Asimina triloba]
MEKEEFHMQEPEARSRASSTWSGDDDMVRAEEVIFAKDGSRFRPSFALPLTPCHRTGSTPRHRLSHVVRPAVVPNPSEDEQVSGSPINQSDSSEEAPLEGDRAATHYGSLVHGFDEVPEEATPAVDVAEEVVVAPMSLIPSIGGGGSAWSVGETPGVSEDVGPRSPIGSVRCGGEVSITIGRAGATFISESVSVMPIAHSPGSFSNISLPLPMVSDLLFNGGGVDALNVDNVDRPLRLPGVDAPILSDSFFALASPGHAERSPSSVHRAGSSGDGVLHYGTQFAFFFSSSMSEVEGPVHRRILTICLPTGSTLKGADAVSGRAVEPIAPVEGGAVEAVAPDSDEGSGGNSSMEQHVPIDGGRRVAVGEGSPRRDGSRGSSSAPTPPLDINVEFIEPFWEFGMDAVSDSDDLNQLLDLCDALEESLRTFGAKLVGLPDFDATTDETPFLNLEQKVKKLSASVEENKRQYHLTLEIKNQLIKERDTKVALVNATKAHLAEIDVELPSC